jgi:DNA mismatch repair protein MutS
VRAQGVGGGGDMTFHSILFGPDDRRDEEPREAPDCFADLRLDQIVDAITAGRDEYDLKPFYCVPLSTVDAIVYRHDVMRDLQRDGVLESIRSFSEQMGLMRRHLKQADKLYYKHQKERLFLDAADVYCRAVMRLDKELAGAPLTSHGFLAFREYVREYAAAGGFRSLDAEIQGIKHDLSAVGYAVLINGDSVTVRKYDGEIDYSIDVGETFERFKQGAVKDYTVAFPAGIEMNHVEAKVLDFVAQLYPGVFLGLDNFCLRHADYQDATLRGFDREVQFYVAYLEYVARFEQAGLSVCYPRVSRDKQAYVYEGYDFALAARLVAENSPVVCNDFFLRGVERILVVSGPNQGGKTTFARTFGQVHYLAALGCPVAGRDAHTFLFDSLLTHFEREESIANLRGKLEDDLVRIHNILARATPDSIVIMNEIFTSTALQDAVFLSRNVMNRIVELDVLSVWVTFIDELASAGEKTVSMVSTVVPENPAVRTYKIVRRRADGLAYALSIAEKHRLTYAQLSERIRT